MQAGLLEEEGHGAAQLQERALLAAVRSEHALLGLDEIGAVAVVVDATAVEARAHSLAAQPRKYASLEGARVYDHLLDLDAAADDLEQPAARVHVEAPERYVQIVVPEELLVRREVEALGLSGQREVELKGRIGRDREVEDARAQELADVVDVDAQALNLAIVLLTRVRVGVEVGVEGQNEDIRDAHDLCLFDRAHGLGLLHEYEKVLHASRRGGGGRCVARGGCFRA